MTDKKICCRLRGAGKNVFVNIKLLDCFQNPKFWQDKDEKSIIVVTEDLSALRRCIPVGVVMPMYMRDIVDDYYKD